MSPRRRLPVDPYFLVGTLSVLVIGGAVLLRAGPPAARGPTALPPGLVQALDGLGVGRSLGPADAPVHVVELSDYECPACAASHPSTWASVRRHAASGAVRYTLYDLPLPGHRNAVPAAVVAHCVAEDGDARFWAFRARALERQADWRDAYPAEPALLALAAETGADTAAVGACVARTGSARAAALRKAWEMASAAGVTFTPAWAVDGKIVRWNELDAAIGEARAARERRTP